MRYEHRFTVQAPLSIVVDFHTQSASMGAITPPPVIVKIHQAPPVLAEGDKMDFTLWLGPFPLRWVAQIENVLPASFEDRQLLGPYAHWRHRHSFQALDDNTTQVVDDIDFSFKSNLFWKVVGLGMRLNLPLLFAYRGWKTKRLLET